MAGAEEFTQWLPYISHNGVYVSIRDCGWQGARKKIEAGERRRGFRGEEGSVNRLSLLHAGTEPRWPPPRPPRCMRSAHACVRTRGGIAPVDLAVQGGRQSLTE